MTDTEYEFFMEHYRKLRLGSMAVEFVILWRKQRERFELADLLEAVDLVAADPRAKFPLNDLPLLTEHAQDEADARKPGWIDPFKGQPAPVQGTPWNQMMLSKGLITRNEFNKRERAKELA